MTETSHVFQMGTFKVSNCSINYPVPKYIMISLYAKSDFNLLISGYHVPYYL